MKKKMIIMSVILIALSFVIPFSYALLKKISSGNGTLVAATWNVVLDQSAVSNHLSIVSGDSTSSASYVVNIKSTSQVDVVYSIIVEDLEPGISVSLDGGTPQPVTDNKVIFNEIGTINYTGQEESVSHTLTFTAAANASPLTEQEVNVNVIARQVLNS